MVYLGLADDEEYAEYAEYEEPEHPQYGQQYGQYRGPHGGYPPDPNTYGPDSVGVRALPRDESSFVAVPPDPSPSISSAVRTLPAQSPQRLHIVAPSDFNEGAKEMGDRFKARAPVIMNLSLVDKHVAKRLLDFASGLTYGLSGRMQKVGEGVFLLTPPGVEVSAEEKRRLRETGILFDGLDR
jgi:cell division inhibitor SepF